MPAELLPIFGQPPANQLRLAFSSGDVPGSVATTPQISELLHADCAVAIGVSGGKDSQACALRTSRYLDEIGHNGPRVLVHADLGAIEWRDSLPACERLAHHLGLDLLVVRRRAGDMLSRWQQRWANNVTRYRELSCVRLILPWSTPSMRFCTSDMKLAPITSALKRRYPHLPIINVSGIRRQESAARSRMPISAIEPRLQRRRCPGLTWNPILEWSVEEVFAEIRQSGLSLHEAYTKYGSSRVSCAFCIMSSSSDLSASATCSANRDVYVSIVELEAESTFAFQGTRWLADVAPHLLSADLIVRIGQAKMLAELRKAVESEIPEHLLYTRGWPTVLPSAEEAELIAGVRRRVSHMLSLGADYLTGGAVRDRYAALLEAKKTASRERSEGCLPHPEPESSMSNATAA